jgi:hypothetical protein
MSPDKKERLLYQKQRVSVYRMTTEFMKKLAEELEEQINLLISQRNTLRKHRDTLTLQPSHDERPCKSGGRDEHVIIPKDHDQRTCRRATRHSDQYDFRSSPTTAVW